MSRVWWGLGGWRGTEAGAGGGRRGGVCVSRVEWVGGRGGAEETSSVEEGRWVWRQGG